jgi:hypothetical protein
MDRFQKTYMGASRQHSRVPSVLGLASGRAALKLLMFEVYFLLLFG